VLAWTAGTAQQQLLRFSSLVPPILAGKKLKAPVDEVMKGLTNKEREKFVPGLDEILIKNRHK
jgi:hypothetical protein